ncbi:hypothetical protein CHS0354_026922 [Potamilus streckersoni]|uniref:Uncharacterized protein n=1 Tax=Potamilus streckersoni TaxID=2493646 RepID=A0AAE0SPB8_9BIVA|nr:hypothetical protein CHS0354_026922 [Potamilus streckersoni]
MEPTGENEERQAKKHMTAGPKEDMKHMAAGPKEDMPHAGTALETFSRPGELERACCRPMPSRSHRSRT